ncbi:MAG: hypothetical protein LBE08_10795 [Bifidobacteriaceae bacterium]|nr:hypothetical protein [Bifidobacteriaceae bacterium]
MSYQEHLALLNLDLRQRIEQAQEEVDWLRAASGQDLLDMATERLNLRDMPGLAEGLSAQEFGDLHRSELLNLFIPYFPAGTSTAGDLADQIQLCRAFADPSGVTAQVTSWVAEKVALFPRSADDLRVGSNPGDVLDPFILAANYELLSDQSLSRTIEHTASHKVLMKIEDLVGHLHENVIGLMRGNFRVPEPQGSREEGKEPLSPGRNPFPGADVGQVPLPSRPETIRLFQVKSKTGSAKGGDGKRLGEQLTALETTYDADTFYVAVVGNTLKGHRSRGAVEKASPNTAILVGESALNELTQSRVGGELLLRTYQRAFRAAAQSTGYSFTDTVGEIAESFEADAEMGGTDFLSAWLHEAIGGDPETQDSRMQRKGRRQGRLVSPTAESRRNRAQSG